MHLARLGAARNLEYVPAGHSWQVLELDAPSSGENLPEGQLLQASDPTTVLYLPAAHAKQAPPSGPVEPAMQTQSNTVLLPAGELEPEGQLMQASDPTAVLYLPAIHRQSS